MSLLNKLIITLIYTFIPEAEEFEQHLQEKNLFWYAGVSWEEVIEYVTEQVANAHNIETVS